MMNCLYKTRMSLFNLDLFLLIALDVVGFFLNKWLGLVVLLFVIFTFVSILSIRIHLYEDKIILKTGLIFKCSIKTVPLSALSCVSCTTNIVGKLFNFGDIYLGGVNDRNSFILKNIKSASMLCVNINELLYRDGQKR